MRCDDCPRGTDPLFCGSSGGSDSEIVIIGQSPDQADLITGKPWSDGSGKILYAAMKEVGLRFDDTRMIYLTNCMGGAGTKKTIKLGGHTLVRGNNLSKPQLSACSDRLVSEVRACSRARVVVTLGAAAFQRVTGLTGKLKQYHCHPIKAEECTDYQLNKKQTLDSPLPSSCEWVVPMYDPITVMFSKSSADFGALKAGFQHVQDLLQGTPQFIMVDGAGTDLRALKRVLPSGPIAMDIETEGLDKAIKLISVACVDQVTGNEYSGSFPWTPQVMAEIQRLLDFGLPAVFHNAAFDVPRIERYGLVIRGPLWDTMWAHQLLQPEMEKSLAAVSGFVLKVAPWKHTSKESPGWYNRMDSVVTLRLVKPLREMLQNDGLLELFEGTMMPVLRILIDMTKRGIKVDNDKVEKWSEKLLAQAEAELASLAKVIPSTVNLRSHVQLKKLLYEDMGFPMQYNGDKLTADKGALKKLAKIKDGDRCTTCKGKGHIEIVSIHAQGPAASCKRCGGSGRVALSAGAETTIGHLAEYNRVMKLASTYTHMRDEVHPSYFPTGKEDKDDDRYGTATGRLSSNSPNIQNQPSEAREIYVPRPGFALLSHDYSQIELRIVAELAQCIPLLDAFRDGADIHSLNMETLGCDRTRAKNLVYGTLYGAGAKTLKASLEKEGFTTSLKECVELQNAFFAAYPEIKRWRDHVVAEVNKQGYARNCFGRRRYFYKASRQVPAILNFHPQSVSADVILEVIPPVQKIYLEHGGHLLAQIHDELLGEILIKSLEIASLRITRAMEREFPQVSPGFRCPVNAASSLVSWKEAK